MINTKNWKLHLMSHSWMLYNSGHLLTTHHARRNGHFLFCWQRCRQVPRITCFYFTSKRKMQWTAIVIFLLTKTMLLMFGVTSVGWLFRECRGQKEEMIRSKWRIEKATRIGKADPEAQSNVHLSASLVRSRLGRLWAFLLLFSWKK